MSGELSPNLCGTTFAENTMSGIDERGNAFEKKFAHDEALKFKAEARRNKLLGLWAAEKMGKKLSPREN